VLSFRLPTLSDLSRLGWRVCARVGHRLAGGDAREAGSTNCLTLLANTWFRQRIAKERQAAACAGLVDAAEAGKQIDLFRTGQSRKPAPQRGQSDTRIQESRFTDHFVARGRVGVLTRPAPQLWLLVIQFPRLIPRRHLSFR
jgi:hypothetical protein